MTENVAGSLTAAFQSEKLLSVPRGLIRFFGNAEVALVFNQILFWQYRSRNEWIEKSDKDWESETGIKPFRIREIIRKLVESKFVVAKYNGDSAEYRVIHQLFTAEFEKFIINPASLEKSHRSSPQTLLEDLKDTTRSTTTTNTKPMSRKTTCSGPPYQEIINMLNAATGKRFRVTNIAKRLINGRWDDGFRLPDFEKVIENMAENWGTSEKMKPYLRPQTLFTGKFDSYLNWGGNNGSGGRHAPIGGTRSGEGAAQGKYAQVGETIEM